MKEIEVDFSKYDLSDKETCLALFSELQELYFSECARLGITNSRDDTDYTSRLGNCVKQLQTYIECQGITVEEINRFDWDYRFYGKYERRNFFERDCQV